MRLACSSRHWCSIGGQLSGERSRFFGGTQPGRGGELGPRRRENWGSAESISIRDAAELLAVSEVPIGRMVVWSEVRGYRVGRRVIRIRVDELSAALGPR